MGIYDGPSEGLGSWNSGISPSSQLCPNSHILPYRVQNASVEVRMWAHGRSPAINIASVLTFFSIYSKVFSFVQTLTGCEDQAKLFKDEVRRAGG